MRVILLLWLLCLPLAGAAGIAPPKVFGAAAIVIDAADGRVLYAKAADERRAIASTQKLLTALLVADHGQLETTFTIDAADVAVEPTKIGVRAGDNYTRRQLLEALLVKSGNDVAVALARDHSGSVEAFAAHMNQRAWELGALNSRFLNPNGLPDDAQYSTARDIAQIARAVYHHPLLRGVVAMKTLDFQYANGTVRTFTNTNRVLRNWEPCNGMKTGYTRAAGHCLVSSAHFDGKDIIAVVLGSNRTHVWDDSAQLLRWALTSP